MSFSWVTVNVYGCDTESSVPVIIVTKCCDG